MSKKFDIKIFTTNQSACTSILDTSYKNTLVGPKNVGLISFTVEK